MTAARDEAAAQVEVVLRGDRAIAILGGELDIANAAAIVEELRLAVPDAAHAVVLDLSGLEFLDSTAIRCLFGLVTRFGERRLRSVVVAAPGSGVARVLELVRFESAAPVVGSTDAALSLLATAPRPGA
jgi:anti-anti-sigma factor